MVLLRYDSVHLPLPTGCILLSMELGCTSVAVSVCPSETYPMIAVQCTCIYMHVHVHVSSKIPCLLNKKLHVYMCIVKSHVY